MHVQSVEHGGRRRDARLLVIDRSDAAVEERGRRWLAEIVAHRPEHHDRLPRPVEIVDARPRFVDDEQRVHPDVTFGVPLGFLLASDQRVNFGEQAVG